MTPVNQLTFSSAHYSENVFENSIMNTELAYQTTDEAKSPLASYTPHIRSIVLFLIHMNSTFI